MAQRFGPIYVSRINDGITFVYNIILGSAHATGMCAFSECASGLKFKVYVLAIGFTTDPARFLDASRLPSLKEFRLERHSIRRRENSVRTIFTLFTYERTL